MKWILIKKGKGKFEHLAPKDISESRAKRLESEGKKVYHSEEEARKDI